VAAVVVITAGRFLPHQALWIDEATQLSGLTLSPGDLVGWLTHPATRDFGVPADRMPPLSYWLGWLWSRPFGLTEASMRWLGVACTAGAAALLFSAARRAFGLVSALFAALFLALSPNVCVTAVEIRAYPLFLLLAAGVARAVVVMRDARGTGDERRPAIILGVWLIAAIYTHFFGALLAGLVVCGLGLERRLERRPLGPVVGLAVAVALAVAGLVPFVIASAAMSTDVARERAREVVQLAYRLLGHPALAVYPLATVATLGAAAALVVATRRLPPGPRATFRFFALIVAAGIAFSAMANFLPLGFTAAKVSYATWALPLVAFGLSAPLALAAGPWARVAQVAAVVLCLGQATGVAQLWRHGSHFAHGPQRGIQQVIERLRDKGVAQGVAVVHVDSALAELATTYYPLRFVNGAALAQFVVVDPGAAPPLLGVALDPTNAAEAASRLSGYRHLVVVRSRFQTARMLADQIRHGDADLPDSATIGRLEGLGWRPADHQLFVAFVAADVTVLERAVGASGEPAGAN
jgi:hypothetical protein